MSGDRRSPSSRGVFALTGSALLVLSTLAASTVAQTPATAPASPEKKVAKAPPPPPPAPCRGPAPQDADLAAGLELVLNGRAREALPRLQAWVSSPDAAKDPAAGRGYYSYAFALRAARRLQEAPQWDAKAEQLLLVAAAKAPSLETSYYLASLYGSQRATAKQQTAQHNRNDPFHLPSLSRIRQFLENASKRQEIPFLVF